MDMKLTPERDVGRRWRKSLSGEPSQGEGNQHGSHRRRTEVHLTTCSAQQHWAGRNGRAGTRSEDNCKTLEKDARPCEKDSWTTTIYQWWGIQLAVETVGKRGRREKKPGTLAKLKTEKMVLVRWGVGYGSVKRNELRGKNREKE